MANRWFTQFYGSLHKKPVQLDCNFIVDSSNGNGLGIRSLKGPGIANVFMHTTASFLGTTHSDTSITGISDTSSLVVGMPISGSGIAAGTLIASIVSSTAITISIAASSSLVGTTISYAGVGSPNPASGLILVQLQDNFYRYFFGTSGFVSPPSGSNINISTVSSLTLGVSYIITSVGTTTTAQWQAVGLPIGMTPAVGVSFIAKATSGSGTGVVQLPAVSGISSIEVVGNPNLTIVSSAATVLGFSSGAYLLLQCLAPSFTAGAYTPSGTISTGVIPVAAGTAGDAVTNNAGVLNSVGGQDVSLNAQTFTGAAASLTGSVSYARTAPANESVLGLSFFLSNSVILQQGE